MFHSFFPALWKNNKKQKKNPTPIVRHFGVILIWNLLYCFELVKQQHLKLWLGARSYIWWEILLLRWIYNSHVAICTATTEHITNRQKRSTGRKERNSQASLLNLVLCGALSGLMAAVVTSELLAVVADLRPTVLLK